MELLSLSDAVRAYSERWGDWLALNGGNKAEAMRVLNSPDSLPAKVMLDAELASKGYPGDQTREARQRVREAQMLADEIIEGFIGKCSRGELTLHGITPPSQKLQRIPSELLLSLIFDLERSTARAGTLEYLGIGVRRAQEDADIGGSRTIASKRPTVADADLRDFVETKMRAAARTPTQQEVYKAALAKFSGKIVTRRRVRVLWCELAPGAKQGPRKAPIGQ
jgi:hypothetical protein